MLINVSELKQRFDIKVDGILHIGAHTCEELKDYLSLGVDPACVIWIEAQPQLVEQNKKENPQLNIYQALIDVEDNKQVCFHVTKNDVTGDSQSSSILEFGSHAKSHPQVKIANTVHMITSRMDSVIKRNNIPMHKINFINLDIQGVELRALKSMESYLPHIDYIYTEVNTEEVYKGCDQMDDLTQYLSTFGFKLADSRIYKEYGWGDAFYIKNR